MPWQRTSECEAASSVVLEPQKAVTMWFSVKRIDYLFLSFTPRTVAYQAPLSMEFSRQELEWVAISFSRGSS